MGVVPSCGLSDDIRTTPSSPVETFAAVISATPLNNREAEANILFGFIDSSDRAVLTDCAGYTGNDGYSFRSDSA
ncbi:MAG TPA: hypothetical protein DIT89_06225 [Planctomycetaceae bacterium]|nr:hypothetical protein [Planctomycetaceae bacterium]